MKPLVIYHAHCADGFGAAFAAWLKFGEEAEYVPMQYGTIPEESMYTNKHLYILDFSFPLELLQDMAAKAKAITLCDHHKTAMETLYPLPKSKVIQLTRGKKAYIDELDLHLVFGYSWAAQSRGGAIAYDGGGKDNASYVYMHHLILPKKEGYVTDHINCNTLDNRRCNLRYATKQQNAANMDRGYEYKGITAHGSGYKAQITVEGINKVLGTFKTKEEAAQAYDDEAEKVFGEFALLNFKGHAVLPPNVEIILDDNKSGAMLAWQYFHPGTEVPMLIKHIDDYDRWQFKIEGTKEFNKALWSYAPWSFEQWININLCVEENYHAVSSEVADKYEYGRLLLEGAAILRAHDANVKAVVKGVARKCMLNLSDEPGFEPKGLTLYGLAANCPPHLASDVGHQLANQSGTYGLLWSINKEGKCICSLRSNGDYDVSAIAKTFGGGGHKNAAGFEVSVETLLEWIK